MDDPIKLVALVILVLTVLLLYYQLSKHHRLRALRKLGFRISTASNTILKHRLKLIAPIHMSDPELDSGVIASYSGLLVFWCATLQSNGRDINCWCFRKCESNTADPIQKWSQAIHITGLSANNRNLFISEATKMLDCYNELNNDDNGVLIVYDRPLFSFSATLNALRLAIRYSHRVG